MGQVVGSASTLVQDEHWSNLVNSAKDRDCFFEVLCLLLSFGQKSAGPFLWTSVSERERERERERESAGLTI